MQDRSLSRRTVLASATVVAASTTGLVGAAAAPAAARKRDDRLARIIARMSIEAKIGQLFVPYFYGTSATSPSALDQERNLRELGVRTVAELIAKYHVGGVIYFSGWANNIQDPRQIADLTNGVQRASLALPTPVPSLISIDQEHGANVRIGSGATQLPGAMALGAGGSLSDARTAGLISGTELAALGIRQNFAPVADVNVNPANPIINVRSFGADPRAVGRMVAAQVTGYQRAGVVACAKHFPGHGDTGEDSHTGLPVITHTREEWERIDAPPFRAAIAAGVDSIMTAHLQVPALDPSNEPATLSPAILQGVLRGELGFDGVIVTDALNMRGVRTKYGDDRVPVLALKAGVDQLLFPPNIDVAYKGVLAAVHSGEITEARLDESVLRILRLKDKVGLLSGSPYVSPREVDRVVGARRHRIAAARIAERTTTLLVNEDAALPCAAASGNCWWSAPARPSRPTARAPRCPSWPGPSTNWAAAPPTWPPAGHPTRRRSTKRWPPPGAGTRWWSPPTTSTPPVPSARWCPGCSRRASPSSTSRCATPMTSRTWATSRPRWSPTAGPRSNCAPPPG